MPLYKNMPPMSALLAFESSARLSSFKDAADELCITPSAVSHQIKSLEAFVGAELFIRHNRRIELSDHGKQYSFIVRQTFEMLNSATKQLKMDANNHVLRLVVAKTFGELVLLPLLEEYKNNFPQAQIECELISEVDIQNGIDFDNIGADMAIMWGVGTWSNADVWGLFETRISVFASPMLFANDRLPVDALEMAKYPWIVNTAFPSGWKWWLASAGLDDAVVSQSIIEVNSNDEAYQLASDGVGIFLMDKTLLKSNLDNGTLISLTEKDVSSFAYYLCCPVGVFAKDVVVDFRDWLLNQAKMKKWPELKGMLRFDSKGNVSGV